jgi:hypothetical protein
MATQLFHLQITGVILSEEQEENAVAALARILVLPLSEAELLFSHAPVIIKENISHDEALPIESQLTMHGIESQRLPSTDTRPPPESVGTHDKLMDASKLNYEEIDGLSLTADWSAYTDDPATHEAVDDIHSASHKARDLSNFNIDDLSLQEVPDEPVHESVQQPVEPEYTGPERRKDQRRQHDRREMIRFETPQKPKKTDRRSGKDRRKSATAWTKDHSHF